MKKICKKCETNFEIREKDKNFLGKISSVINEIKQTIPEPTLCPECRQQRRCAFRNERNLYKRKCDLSKNTIISNYSSDKPYKVYGYNEWWGDKWNPLKYGQNFDFSKTFFEQFNELLKKTPRLYLYNAFSENSEYTNHAYHNKNCYLIFNTAYNENVYYSTNLIVKCKDCSDCITTENSELLYSCIYVKNCYNSKFLVHCLNCRDSSFLYDCKNCSNCFMCSNLRNKKYYILNKKYTKEDYEKILNQYDFGEYSETEKFTKIFLKNIKEKTIHKNLYIENSENCKGDYIFNSKNIDETFFADKCEDISYCYDALENKNCMDTYESSINCELQYECYACNESIMMKFCILSFFSYNLEYCDYCFNCKDCFGCTGLKKKQYCILNKQYSKEEYFILKNKIIEYMKKTKEYGEFFPISLSPFGYNETIAQEYYPINKNQAETNNYNWKEKDEKQNIKSNYKINKNIKKIPENITNEILICKKCSKNYKIIPQELNFYKKLSIPIPHKCFHCRHKERLENFRNPRKLWDRNCSNCNTPIKTSYSPENNYKIYCEKCYLQEIY